MTPSIDRVTRMQTTRLDSRTLDEMRSAGKDFYLLFTASWCGFCAALKKELEASPPDFQLFEMDISDESHVAWDEYRIQVVPTALFFKGGGEHSRKAATFKGLSVREIRALSGASATVPR